MDRMKTEGVRVISRLLCKQNDDGINCNRSDHKKFASLCLSCPNKELAKAHSDLN